jgi:hypothetical protein
MRKAAIFAALCVLACSTPLVKNTDNARGGGSGGAPSFTLPPTPVPAPVPPRGTSPLPGGAGAATPVCAATRAEATPLPVDLYVMEDQSGSMGMGGKWEAVKAALTAFVQLPALSGMGIGLGFFPKPPGTISPACMSCSTQECLTNCGCIGVSCTNTCINNVCNNMCTCSQFGNSCIGEDYAAPAVPIAELPGASRAFVDALNAVRPGGGTPTRPALEGAIQYARSWGGARNRRVAIALATDGQPAGCGDNTIASISTLAQNARAEGLFTFVIGVGSSLDNLNAIASAGGTEKAYLVDGADLGNQFLSALQSIRGTAARLACAYAIPTPPAGQTLDPARVNVELSGGSPPGTTTLGQVRDRSECGPRGGWHYDNPAAPKQIQLCEATCNAVNGGLYQSIAVTFGCRTVTTID